MIPRAAVQSARQIHGEDTPTPPLLLPAVSELKMPPQETLSNPILPQLAVSTPAEKVR